MSTHCRTIQLLEPDPPSNLTVSDDDDSLAVEEGGLLVLVEGVTEYDVLFEQEKLNADYDFIESDISNEVDGDPLAIVPTMNERTTLGYHLTIDALPDTANYRFHWRCRVTSV